MAVVPDPKQHPNGYTALSWGSVAALIVVELHNRFGVDISIEESSFAVAIVAAGVVFLKGKVGR